MGSRRARRSGLLAVLAVGFLGLAGRPSPAQAPAAREPIDLKCAAECQRDYDRSAGIAEGLLQRKGYSYSASSTNCSTAWDSTRYHCAATHEACAARCGLYDAACKSPCSAAFQMCCYGTALGNAAHHRAECLKGCPRLTSMDAALRPTMMPREDEERAQEALESLRTEAEKASDDARREKAFDEARAEIRKRNAAFALVVGGAGRLWIVRADGPAVLLSRANRDLLRRGSGSARDVAESLLAQGELGLGEQDARNLAFAAAKWPIVNGQEMTAELKAPDALYFPAGEIAPEQLRKATASSEHSSIRGTINGGGDFI